MITTNRKTPMVIAPLLAATAMFVQAGQAIARPKELPAPKAKLIAKGETYLVHALPGSDGGHRFERMYMHPGVSVLYTSLKPADGSDATAGEMTRLIHTGTWEVNTERISYHQSRVVGVVADKQRLYVAVWHSGRIYDRPPNPYAKRTGGTYVLTAFSLADGKKITGLGLVGSGPKTVPGETVEAGVLHLEENGVSCFGTRLEFEGNKLVKTIKIPEGEKK